MQPEQSGTQAQRANAEPEAGMGAGSNKMPQQPVKLHGKPRTKLWIGMVVVAIVIVAAAYYLYTYMPGVLPAI